ncbi:uncharacterized protein LOC124629667 [Helicoverpa zea]|uniref:uncharacterized protein LOC124629667 n=1 Tax=Helicoverpa zea TaxID=7113 RepID=UPI001F567051|nr:uncharacterized protein LOC124629667 [Helicoverpa zea]
MYNNKRFLANGIVKTLFNQKAIIGESATDIKNLLSTTTDCLESIKNLDIDLASILIIHIITEKLDKVTRRAWELKVSSDPKDDLPTFDELKEFLVNRFRALENLETKVERVPKTTRALHVVKDKGVSCTFCTGEHKLSSCPKFIKESTENRRNFVLKNKLCFICLLSNHSVKFCKNTLKCQVCKRRHHSLLHPQGVVGSEVGEGSSAARAETSSVTYEGNKDANQAEGSKTHVVSCLATGTRKTVLLTTALIKVESKDGSYRVVRALLDQGSQGSFVTESTVQYLGLHKTPSKQVVIGVGGDKSATAKSSVILTLRSRIDPSVVIRVNAFVLKSVTALLPSTKVTRVEWVDLTDDDLADPEYYRPNKIDVLLGADVYSQVIQEGIKKNVTGTLLAQDTKLGWILSGTLDVDQTINSHITVMHSRVEGDDMLRKFWELEEPSGTKEMLTEEETKCEELFKTTTTRDKDGRYVVRLPLRDTNLVDRGVESKGVAEKRLKGLEARLAKNDKLKVEYAKVIQEYLSLNHMVEVSDRDNIKGVYLPHHAVIREDKETTKVRVVFDASCKYSNGRSLNDDLMVGPSLQDELRHIIMRWRVHRICIVSDIIKMYRQVLVNRQDTPLQRILWRDSPEKETKAYELITVTFGTASAPYLAVKALQQLAVDECGDNLDMAKIIVNDFYMDDLMSGAETKEDAFKIYTEITKILGKGGFKLQKWKSNCQELLNKIRDGNDEALQIKIDELTKILGLTWNARDDCFQYSLELKPLAGPVTKRKIIADIARLFDPLGWLAPSIIVAKTMIQKLWLAGLQWDEEVPKNLLKEWVTYRENLASLVDLKIPRWLNTGKKVKQELYGFSDASKLAYAAVVYLRVVDEMGVIYVSLIASKTKVAPVKQVSIPRLELCGAVLLTKLILEVADVMNIQKENLYAFTDSEVVLAWLNSHPSRWKTFVANRVSEILSNLDTHHWAHVASKQNPADCASRGICPSELSKVSLWWEGPNFLKEPVFESKRPKQLVTHLEEIKVHTSTLDLSFWKRFSKLSRMIRVIAYCRRFLNLRKNGVLDRVKGSLSTQELENATEICIKRCQEEEFANELEKLKSNKVGRKNSKLNSLNIFLDPKGIIRVGGRLEMSQLNYERAHPILIPRESFLTKLLITDAHEKTMHGGPQLMITYLRSKYWIIGIKALAKRYAGSCVKCIRYTAKVRTQLMGQLPSSRATPAKPFLRSGVDYAGPISIRVSKGRGNKSYKGYIALFVCMVTRAVHLEAVSDLSTKGFLAAFRRFVARRGRCAELHSDNGTNFVGAARELLHLFNEERSACNPELADELGNNGTEWHFIPPQSPNFGGLWEAGVRSTKHHLKRVIGNSTLTFEEITTVLAQIEACLNSRPLSYVEDQDKLTILTPGHFLVGEPLVLPPDSNYERSNVSNLRRWHLLQKMMQEFWRRWSHDYLHQFLQRHKWQNQTPEPSVGDIVLIKEDNMPPGRWLLGRVEGKHPGSDGLTRVVTIRTKLSTIKRPTSKVCVLPVAD